MIKKTSRDTLRMKDLTEATGLPKSTILHYVAQGLLPEPTRTGRNMAYYNPACIERAKFIKRMQGRYSFPLDRIKKLLRLSDEGKDITHLVELDAVIFGAEEAVSVDEKEYLRATGLTREELSELLAANLILPWADGSYRPDDIEAGRALAAALKRGIKARDLTFFVRAARDLSDHMMRLRERLTSHLPDEEDARVTAELTHGARLLRNYVLDHTFQRRVSAAKSLKDKELLS
ncbi:MAG TPA: MerR family transcriptional regulator [Syntrophorhabdaceae bacterium]|nr:MerR family transcriptional regulator [Syntrophorhabdaceae bacterium]